MRSPSRVLRFQPQSALRSKLPFAGSPKVRVAQVGSSSVLFEEARYFACNELQALQQYAPEVLLGSCEDLLQLSKRTRQNQVSLCPNGHAMFVLTNYRDVPLRDPYRTILWQTFGVPIYELLLGSEGVFLAAECEAFEGLHVAKGVTFASIQGQLWYSTRRGNLGGTGLIGDLETLICPCGRAGQRLMNIAVDLRDAVRHRFSATT